MGTAFWIRRSVTVFALTMGVLFVVSLAKDRGLAGSVEFAAGWGAVTTAVFIGSRLYQSRRGQECALCNDIPAAIPAASTSADEVETTSP